MALVDVLNLANKGKTPRVTQKALEEYIENEDTDIDDLFDQVMGFFGKSNATKRQTKQILEAIKTEA